MERIYLTRMIAPGENPLSLGPEFYFLIESRRCLLMDYQAQNGGDYGITSFDADNGEPVLAVADWQGREPNITHESIVPLPTTNGKEILTAAKINEFHTKISGRFSLPLDLEPKAGDEMETWLSYLVRLCPSHEAGKDFSLGNYRVRAR